MRSIQSMKEVQYRIVLRYIISIRQIHANIHIASKSLAWNSVSDNFALRQAFHAKQSGNKNKCYSFHYYW